MKSQFKSTETLSLRLPAFIDKSSGLIIDGSDICTIVARKPDNTTATYNDVSTPAVLYDATTKTWKLDITTGSYVQGTWAFYITSNNANATPQWRYSTWGDYVDNIGSVDLTGIATTTDVTSARDSIKGSGLPSIADVQARLGAPAGASHAADIAGVQADTDAIQATLASGVASTADVNAARDSIKGLDNKNITEVYNRLGAPAGASVSADIAAVGVSASSAASDAAVAATHAQAANNKLGTPAGASVSADVASVKADTVAIKPKTDALPVQPANEVTSQSILTEAQEANAAAQAAESSSATAATQATQAASNSDDLRKIAVGRWKIQGTQLILYELDGTTPYKAFDLKDDAGQPTSQRIYERVPV